MEITHYPKTQKDINSLTVNSTIVGDIDFANYEENSINLSNITIVGSIKIEDVDFTKLKNSEVKSICNNYEIYLFGATITEYLHIYNSITHNINIECVRVVYDMSIQKNTAYDIKMEYASILRNATISGNYETIDASKCKIMGNIILERLNMPRWISLTNTLIGEDISVEDSKVAKVDLWRCKCSLLKKFDFKGDLATNGFEGAIYQY